MVEKKDTKVTKETAEMKEINMKKEMNETKEINEMKEISMKNEMKEINVYNLIIIDESGSMSSIYKQALSGINETLNTIRQNQEQHPEQHHYVSIVTFEGNGPQGVKLRRDRIPVGKIENMGEKDYRPAGCTPLYDAMGISISHLEQGMDDGAIAFVTVITDGYENASLEYSGKAIRDLVSRKRDMGWTFAYIGANQDAVEVARELNISNAMNFEADAAGTESVMACYCKANQRFSERLSKKMKHACSAMDLSLEKIFSDDEEDLVK